MVKRIHCEVISVPPHKMPVIPSPAMLEPFSSSRLHNASSNLGVENRHLMSCPADSTVRAWSMTCSW